MMRDASLDSNVADIVAEGGRDFVKLGTQITLHADGRVFGRFAEEPVEAQQPTQPAEEPPPSMKDLLQAYPLESGGFEYELDPVATALQAYALVLSASLGRPSLVEVCAIVRALRSEDGSIAALVFLPLKHPCKATVEKMPFSPSRLSRSSSTRIIREGCGHPEELPAAKVLGHGFRLWCLAACAGAANVIAYKSWSLYASHVTGSTSNIAFRLEGYQQGEYGSETLAEACSLVFSFLVGAYTCGILIDKNQVHFLGKAFYGLALVLNSALLVSAAFVQGRLLPACLVAAACGLQNAMCTSHFGAIIRTTHATGTMTDIGSTMGRISMIYLRRACRCSQLTDIERAEIGVDAQKLTVLFGLWTFFLFGGLIGIYAENFVQGPRALLVPAFVTGSMGLTYMAFRQILKDYIKKLEQERFSADLQEAQSALAHMGSRLHDLENGKGDATLATWQDQGAG
ncbi:unnamed protein product [Symbiodinium sp. CCMP2592]|nr:unnamed protein product [Symbiodinium sp. CCMP2592]